MGASGNLNGMGWHDEGINMGGIPGKRPPSKASARRTQRKVCSSAALSSAAC